MNIAQVMAEHAIKNPNKKVLVSTDMGFLTYAQAVETMQRISTQLSFLEPGTVVGLTMKDSFASFITRMSCAQLGLILVALFEKLPAEEFARRHALAKCQHVVADEDYEVISAYPHTVININNLPVECHASYHASGNDPITFTWSGGTNGTPDGMVHTHSTMIAVAEAAHASWLPEFPDDVCYIVSPMISSMSMMYQYMVAYIGATMVISQHPFSPALVEENVVELGVTHLMGIPAIFSVMLRRGKLIGKSPKWCYSAGDAIGSQLCTRWEQTTGGRLRTLLGTSQSGPVFANLGNYPMDSLGQIMPWTEVKLLDDDDNEVGEGKVGQLWIKSPTCAVADFPLNGISLIRDGWITTHDMLLQRDGLYYFVGRKNDTFKVNGLFVRPYSIEEHARSIVGVEDAIAVPDIDNEGISKVKVYVVADPTTTDWDRIEREVRAVNSKLESHERPYSVEFIEEIPRHPMSMKVQRFRLNPLFTKAKESV